MRSFWLYFKNYDSSLLIVTGLLTIFGLTVIYSIARSAGTPVLFYRQAIYAVVGIVGFFILAGYNYHKLAKLNRLLYIGLFFLLIYLLIFGDPIRGSARWIDFGVFNFQPAEFAKISIILGMSRWLYLKRGQINSWKSIVLTLLYAGAPAVLIAKEPDLGSSIIIMSIWLGILLISSMKKSYLIAFFIVAIILAGFGWEFVLKDYQKTRVEVFLNPNLDPKGKGYNVRQAIIAVGSGEVLGRGLGQGLQSQLKFLPERQTDFVFASASEEIGFVGSCVLLVLYLVMFNRLIYIMRQSRDDLGYYISGGVLFLILAQVVINVGMNIGLLPVTGIPLPFVTAGGSSMIVVFLSLGMAQNVIRQSRALRF